MLYAVCVCVWRWRQHKWMVSHEHMKKNTIRILINFQPEFFLTERLFLQTFIFFLHCDCLLKEKKQERSMSKKGHYTAHSISVDLIGDNMASYWIILSVKCNEIHGASYFDGFPSLFTVISVKMRACLHIWLSTLQPILKSWTILWCFVFFFIEKSNSNVNSYYSWCWWMFNSAIFDPFYKLCDSVERINNVPALFFGILSLLVSIGLFIAIPRSMCFCNAKQFLSDVPKKKKK